MAKKRIKFSAVAAAALAIMAGPDIASAEQLSRLANLDQENLSFLPDLIAYCAYPLGAGMLLKALLLFKKNKANEQTNPLNKPVTYLFAAAFLWGLPSFVSTALETVWSKAAQLETFERKHSARQGDRGCPWKA